MSNKKQKIAETNAVAFFAQQARLLVELQTSVTTSGLQAVSSAAENARKIQDSSKGDNSDLDNALNGLGLDLAQFAKDKLTQIHAFEQSTAFVRQIGDQMIARVPQAINDIATTPQPAIVQQLDAPPDE